METNITCICPNSDSVLLNWVLVVACSAASPKMQQEPDYNVVTPAKTVLTPTLRGLSENFSVGNLLG